MIVKEVEEMLKVFRVPPASLVMTVAEPEFLILMTDLSLCLGRSFAGKTELSFNLGTTKIKVSKI